MIDWLTNFNKQECLNVHHQRFVMGNWLPIINVQLKCKAVFLWGFFFVSADTTVRFVLGNTCMTEKHFWWRWAADNRKRWHGIKRKHLSVLCSLIMTTASSGPCVLFSYRQLNYKNWIKLTRQQFRLQNDLYCVGWGVKLYSLARSLASNRRRSRNNDELSAWSYVSITSMAFPAKTTLLEH